MNNHNIKIDKDGNKRYFVNDIELTEDEFNTEMYQPKLIIDVNDSKSWYLNGELHREDGPAIEYVDFYRAWYINDKRHREDGPAVEYTSGAKYWYKNGLKHREDGPAVECSTGAKYWYLNGEQLTKEEFNNKMSNK